MTPVYTPTYYPNRYGMPMPMASPAGQWGPQYSSVPQPQAYTMPNRLPMPVVPQRPQPQPPIAFTLPNDAVQAPPVPPAADKPAVRDDKAAALQKKARNNFLISGLMNGSIGLVLISALKWGGTKTLIGSAIGAAGLLVGSWFPYIKGKQQLRDSLKNTTRTQKDLQHSSSKKWWLGFGAKIAAQLGFVAALFNSGLRFDTPMFVAAYAATSLLSNLGWMLKAKGAIEKKQAVVQGLRESAARR